MWFRRERQGITSALLEAARRAGLELDASQIAAVASLDRLHRAPGGRRRSGPSGVYLWGPVGRGKTWLLDTFYDAAPTKAKRRVHFHDFFRDLHAAVGAHGSAAHAFDAAVSALVDGCDLMCFDEFHFHDIGDAMLVSRLLRRLFASRVRFVTTSNSAPEDLLPNPLYHHLFQPAIDLIRSQMDVVRVDGPVDYRPLTPAGTGPLGFRSGAVLWPGTEKQLSGLGLRRPALADATAVAVGTRRLQTLRIDSQLIWFDFDDLCDAPTAASDLLVLTEQFSTWVVSGVPPLSDCSADAQQRFVNLVDVLHDRDVRLFLVCDAPPASVTAGDRLPPDFTRTASRLSLLARVEGHDSSLRRNVCSRLPA